MTSSKPEIGRVLTRWVGRSLQTARDAEGWHGERRYPACCRVGCCSRWCPPCTMPCTPLCSSTSSAVE
jgi:hypothetical protein